MITLLGKQDISKVLTRQLAFECARDAFIAYSSGRATSPLPFEMLFTDNRGEVHAKGGYLTDSPSFALKVATAFTTPSGGSIGSGLTMLFSAADGRLTCLVADDGLLTLWRTAGATAYATDLLARADSRKVLLIGSGPQTEHNAAALMAIPHRDSWRYRIWARSAVKARAIALSLSTDTRQIEVENDLEHAVRAADVIVTSTSSRGNGLINPDWLEAGIHITAMGADTPEKRELQPGALALMDLVAVDSRTLTQTVGEVFRARATAAEPTVPVVEIGDIAAGRVTGRTHPGQSTLADLAGLGIQDAVLAGVAVKAAMDQGLGTSLALN